MESALSFDQCFHRCFKNSNLSLPHDCPPDEETDAQRLPEVKEKPNQNKPKQKKQYERARMKGSVIRVYESTVVRGRTLRMNVSRLNALGSPTYES